MKILIGTIGILALLTAVAPSAFALTAYQSGFEHGVSDARSADWYILQPGKGFQFHTWEFVKGCVTGFCSVNPGTSSAQIRQRGTVQGAQVQPVK